MFKKIIMWLFFSVFAGVLPLGLKWLVCGMTGTPFTYSSICPEIFFFNLILSANGLKELYDINRHTRKKAFLFASSIFIIIILSTIYGILLLNDYINVGLSLDDIYLSSQIFTVFCIIINFSIQILGGANAHV